jgi:hypothetical protein
MMKSEIVDRAIECWPVCIPKTRDMRRTFDRDQRLIATSQRWSLQPSEASNGYDTKQ